MEPELSQQCLDLLRSRRVRRVGSDRGGVSGGRPGRRGRPGGALQRVEAGLGALDRLSLRGECGAVRGRQGCHGGIHQPLPGHLAQWHDIIALIQHGRVRLFVQFRTQYLA